MIATNYIDFSFPSSFCHRGGISLSVAFPLLGVFSGRSVHVAYSEHIPLPISQSLQKQSTVYTPLCSEPVFPYSQFLKLVFQPLFSTLPQHFIYIRKINTILYRARCETLSISKQEPRVHGTEFPNLNLNSGVY